MRTVESFETPYGTVNPGDVVYAITEGYNHQISIRRGIYLGFLGTRQNPRVQLEVERKMTTWWDTVDNCNYRWNKPHSYFTEKVERRDVVKQVTTTLQLNRILPLTITVDQLAEAI
jgi:hypothetical protein